MRLFDLKEVRVWWCQTERWAEQKLQSEIMLNVKNNVPQCQTSNLIINHQNTRPLLDPQTQEHVQKPKQSSIRQQGSHVWRRSRSCGPRTGSALWSDQSRSFTCRELEAGKPSYCRNVNSEPPKFRVQKFHRGNSPVLILFTVFNGKQDGRRAVFNGAH